MQSRHTSMSTVIPASTTCPVTTPCPTATSVCPTLTAVEQFKTLPTCSNQLYHANTFAVGPLQLCCNGGSNALGATYHHINWQGGADPTQYQHQAHRKAGTPVNFFYKDDDSHTFLPKVCKKVKVTFDSLQQYLFASTQLKSAEAEAKNETNCNFLTDCFLKIISFLKAWCL